MVDACCLPGSGICGVEGFCEVCRTRRRLAPRASSPEWRWLGARPSGSAGPFPELFGPFQPSFPTPPASV